MAKGITAKDSFIFKAKHLSNIRIAEKVNELGGYGKGGEVIYDKHPYGCPSVLVDSRGDVTATFTSNGSTALKVKTASAEIDVLSSSFDTVEKRETGIPALNIWLSVPTEKSRSVASLINPAINFRLMPKSVRVVKLCDPDRSMWYFTKFNASGTTVNTCVKLSLKITPLGPVITQETLVENIGKKSIRGELSALWNLHGTQLFAYNKEIWYDTGIPLNPQESIVYARVPYSDDLQIKYVVCECEGSIKYKDSTCDYLSFVGDTAASAILPQAALYGKMIEKGSWRDMNRFSSPNIAANIHAICLAPGKHGVLRQSLLYVLNDQLINGFSKRASAKNSSFKEMKRGFLLAGKWLSSKATKTVLSLKNYTHSLDNREPYFYFNSQAEAAASFYANSVWTGVDELYANCRAHGTKLAQGIELGTRDRGQDMWAKMKQAPSLVRKDLIYALSFMYRTVKSPVHKKKCLSLRDKLHGMFPRQFPSRWDDRNVEVMNDNRPYNDSALWLLDSLIRLVRSTGDTSILFEEVDSISLTDPDNPENSSIRGNSAKYKVYEVVKEVIRCLKRHCDDSPYGMVQIIYGDWCDPVDMFGTSKIGDNKTRGQGRGVQTRLSCHFFATLIDIIDLFSDLDICENFISDAKKIALSLRENIIKYAYEKGRGIEPGFIDCIHEFNADGSKPAYAKDKIGYTLGSMKKSREFDGVPRRVLVTQAWALNMLLIKREWLRPLPGAAKITDSVLSTVDKTLFHKELGHRLYSVPLSNNHHTLRMVGRMGIIPSGCAENGEYHHAQAMMHLFRLSLPGEADTVWRQFAPMMSAMKSSSLNGPFETPSTSYASDPADPHFGAGMYFGLSGSTNWIVDIFERIAGVELNLHVDSKPDMVITPSIPSSFKNQFIYKRILHEATKNGEIREIPLTINMIRKGRGKTLKSERIYLNNKRVDSSIVENISDYGSIDIKIERLF